MFRQIKQHRLYFALVWLTLAVGIILHLLFTKTTCFVWLNAFHTPSLDFFFALFTFLGDGIFALSVIPLLFLFADRKKAISLLFAFLTSACLAQVLKRIFQQPRPKLYFEETAFQYLHYVNHITLHSSYSFPSGHTTSAFALATILVLSFKKMRLAVPCFLFAVLVGYSRIYLAQHFLLDVLVGAAIGTLCGLWGYYVVVDLQAFGSFKKKTVTKPATLWT
ncbi:phosphatase PAP2 family protein [Pedobacter sp. KR3-3]|uniref:Phosphatase PAP2 family protein n=1 Tax=Pedobacter albus TaxID=3113905 RepID=A0ABU7IBY4_9SPHI|nr:phosphatase PAP2 family protein [Pedobacter sp. KR3-3]MEE1946796.1 phosphatase PAP2 family protein [Pedobacter sp. KR3-3]